MRTLQLYSTYTRKEVHSIFSPQTVFSPQAGTWGLHGIVDVPERPGDYVFFVTFGQAQGEHQFEEHITDEGLLTWQSQPRQGFKDRRIQDFIRHREEINNIHLFLRTTKHQDYTYLGRLKYLDHDPGREYPVHFAWQILDWPPPSNVLGILMEAAPAVESLEVAEVRLDYTILKKSLIEADMPSRRMHRDISRKKNQNARFRRPDYIANQVANQELGLLGEFLVLRSERERLIAAGRRDLAEQVRHVSVIENDTAGYDIQSFEKDGKKIFLEVKTTRGPADSDFFISASELNFAKTHSSQYRLYRLYDYSDELDSAKFYILAGDPDATGQLRFAPTNFRVSLQRDEGE